MQTHEHYDSNAHTTSLGRASRAHKNCDTATNNECDDRGDNDNDFDNERCFSASEHRLLCQLVVEQITLFVGAYIPKYYI